VDHLYLAAVPCWLRLLRPVPYVLFCHGTEFDGVLSRSRRRAFRGAALRLSNSCFTARRLGGLFSGANVLPCELGMEELALPAAGATVDMLPDAEGRLQPLCDRCVLIVSRLAPDERYKGHDQLIGVWPDIRRQIPDAQLVVAGDGGDRPRLMARARQSGVGSAVLFPGFVTGPTLAALYARCRVFAMPSRGEGFGLVYLEAMRFAKPCIASTMDGGSEVVVDGHTGLLVPPDNLPAIRDATTRLLSDNALAQKLGEAGRLRLESRYRFHHFKERLLERLQTIMQPL
jgi:phosphatidylinositol alpha-1,6-mannosyltransferase